MNSVNLYILTRQVGDRKKGEFERSLSKRPEPLKIRDEEMELIADLIEEFFALGDPREQTALLEDWFYSFTIPQIGKEFDLLRIDKKNGIVNIELKSQEVSEDKVEKQLLQNRYYLSSVNTNIYSFTCMRTNQGKIRVYNYDGSLRVSSFTELMNAIRKTSDPVHSNIEGIFSPENYMISPLNDPEGFCRREYYLTNQQEDIRRQVMRAFSGDGGVFGINGAAGTGKTLLLYDMARTAALKAPVLVIHSEELLPSHILLGKRLSGVNIVSALNLLQKDLSGYGTVFIDETQRLHKQTMDLILEETEKGNIKTLVCAYDMGQALSAAELRRNNPGRLSLISGFKEFWLTGRIRINSSIHAFVKSMLSLKNYLPGHVNLGSVEVVCANDSQEANLISEIYRSKGYVIIGKAEETIGEVLEAKNVIGLEFESVLVIVDEHFRYNDEGELEAMEYPGADYGFPRLFYQSVSRVRSRLCVLVLDNAPVFERLVDVMNGK